MEAFMSALSTQLLSPVGPADHVLGPVGAPITLVEYGDFECVHCGRAYAVVKTVAAELGRNLRFVFRHFPITQLHPHAQAAAEAAEAAAAEGRFWQMYEQLFEHQDALAARDLMSYANRIGLDGRRLLLEVTSHVYTPRVREDARSGLASGVHSTPTFFINGWRYDGRWDDPDIFSALMLEQTRPRTAPLHP